MGWLTEALNELAGADVTAPKPASIAKPKPKPKRDIKTVWIRTRTPRDSNDPGEAAIAYYFVADGFVTLCDAIGKPAKECQIGPGETAERIAWSLAREARTAEIGSDFNRRIEYEPMGIV
jgi:hypothetical protein